MENEKPQISTANIIGLIGLSIFFDIVGLIGLIPIVGTAVNILVDIFAFLSFYVWFKILGVSFVRTRRMMAFVGGFILGALPFTSIIAWTLDVVLVILDVRAEELLKKTPLGKIQKIGEKRLAAGRLGVGGKATYRERQTGGQQFGERWRSFTDAKKNKI